MPFRTMAFWVLVVLLALVAYRMYSGNLIATQRVDIQMHGLHDGVEKGNVDNASFARADPSVTGEFKTAVPQKIATRRAGEGVQDELPR